MVASLFTNLNYVTFLTGPFIIQSIFNININSQHNLCTNCKIPLTDKPVFLIFLFFIG